MKEIGKHIMKQVRKGNVKAFQKLVGHYQQSVYTICILMMENEDKAEELASDTFLYAYSHMDNYYKADKKFSIWLYQSTICLAQKYLIEDDCMNEMRNSLSDNGIQSLLMNVSLKERIALILNCYYHFSDQEIGEILHTPQSEIRTYIIQTREKLTGEIQCMNSAEKEGVAL